MPKSTEDMPKSISDMSKYTDYIPKFTGHGKFAFKWKGIAKMCYNIGKV